MYLNNKLQNCLLYYIIVILIVLFVLLSNIHNIIICVCRPRTIYIVTRLLSILTHIHNTITNNNNKNKCIKNSKREPVDLSFSYYYYYKRISFVQTR